MKDHIGQRFAPLLILAALVLGACTAPDGDLPAEALASLPQGIEVSLESNSIEFTDAVHNIASDQWEVGAFTLTIGADSEIEPGIAIGDTVRVHADLLDDGSLVAHEIAFASDDAATTEAESTPDEPGDLAEDFSADELEFVGTVDAIGADSWTIDGQTIRVTPETEIKADIIVGDLVKVHAFLSDTSEVTAHEIELTDETALKGDDFDAADDMKFVGVLESIEGDTWVIGGESFQVDANTEVDQGLKIGDTVEVYLFLTPDGLTIVREISSFDDELTGDSDSLDDIDDDDDQDHDEQEDDHSGSSESEHSDDGDSGSGHSDDD